MVDVATWWRRVVAAARRTNASDRSMHHRRSMPHRTHSSRAWVIPRQRSDLSPESSRGRLARALRRRRVARRARSARGFTTRPARPHRVRPQRSVQVDCDCTSASDARPLRRLHAGAAAVATCCGNSATAGNRSCPASTSLRSSSRAGTSHTVAPCPARAAAVLLARRDVHRARRLAARDRLLQ